MIVVVNKMVYIETQMSIQALMVKHTSISVRATTNIFLL